MTVERVRSEVDSLYKTHFGKTVTALLRFSDSIDLETAEDFVQDAFSAALTSWQDGIPLNPAGWIYHVARNKAINKIKSDKKFTPVMPQEAAVDERPSTQLPFDDHRLKMLFSLAHPKLSAKVRVVVTLKYVVNFKVEAIAQILGMTIDGVDKLLVRARARIRDEKISIGEPPLTDLKPRLSTVHKIIYLVFNEGYKSSSGKEIIRQELCEESLLMNKALIDAGLGNQETEALQALMLFNVARFKSRYDGDGKLLDLEEQDRSQWDREIIDLACKLLKRSRQADITSYHLEASIAYLHCTATSFEATDWATIAGLYRQMLDREQNPFVELNYSIALYFSGTKDSSIRILEDLQQRRFFDQYYLLNATLGKIHFLEGDHLSALNYFRRALSQTSSAEEKNFIERKMAKTGAR